jgi:hypothetical protein
MHTYRFGEINGRVVLEIFVAYAPKSMDNNNSNNILIFQLFLVSLILSAFIYIDLFIYLLFTNVPNDVPLQSERSIFSLHVQKASNPLCVRYLRYLYLNVSRHLICTKQSIIPWRLDKQ